MSPLLRSVLGSRRTGRWRLVLRLWPVRRLVLAGIFCVRPSRVPAEWHFLGAPVLTEEAARQGLEVARRLGYTEPAP